MKYEGRNDLSRVFQDIVNIMALEWREADKAGIQGHEKN